MGWIDRITGTLRLSLDDASDAAFRIAAWVVRENISTRTIIQNAEKILEWALKPWADYKVLPDESRKIIQQGSQWSVDYAVGFEDLAKTARAKAREAARKERWQVLKAARIEYEEKTGSAPPDDREFSNLELEFGDFRDEPMINLRPDPNFLSFQDRVMADRKILETIKWEGRTS